MSGTALRCPVCTHTTVWTRRKRTGDTITGNCGLCHTRLRAIGGRVHVDS